MLENETWNNSELLDIKPTRYGGRGYFAKQNISAGTVVLECKRPFISVIFKDFKKEVCAYCFSYDRGITRKFRLSKSGVGGSAYAGVYFCADQCRKNWETYHDYDQLLSLTLENIEQGMRRAKKVKEKTEFKYEKGADQGDQLWQNHEKCIQKTKNSRKLSLPQLDESEYDFSRLIAASAVEKYRNNCLVFDHLQSNEDLQLQTFPDLLACQLKIYQFLSLTLPLTILQSFDSDILRKTFGREAANAFGIWELPNRDAECFGSAIYPEGAFFDHQCDPNVSKFQEKGAMLFIANRDIVQGEELCIAYGMLENTDFQTRSLILREQWHFECSCRKCISCI